MTTKLFAELFLSILTNLADADPPEPAAFLWCVGVDGHEGHAPGPKGCEDGTILMECPDNQPDDGSLVNCQPPRMSSTHTADGPCESSFESEAAAAAAMCDTDACCWYAYGYWNCYPKPTAGCSPTTVPENCPSGSCWVAGPGCRFEGPDLTEEAFAGACCSE
jgi:hypothetical protein